MTGKSIPTQECYAYQDTYCSNCKRKIYKTESIAMKHEHGKLISLLCFNCYIGIEPVKLNNKIIGIRIEGGQDDKL